MKTNYADIIKRLVTMQDVVDRYTGEPIVLNRIRCPIHHGQDRNMRIYKHDYYCFTCHASGDVIRFVMEVCGLQFKDAMRKINSDFGLSLPLDTEPSDAERRRLAELDRKIAERRRLEQARMSDAEARERLAAAWIGILHQVEIVCRQQAPATPWDEWREDWCEAMKLRTELYEQIR